MLDNLRRTILLPALLVKATAFLQRVDGFSVEFMPPAQALLVAPQQPRAMMGTPNVRFAQSL
jgi:hypothetical protein